MALLKIFYKTGYAKKAKMSTRIETCKFMGYYIKNGV